MSAESPPPVDPHSCERPGAALLHELWLRDPSGYLIEVYARLTDEELKQMPSDQEPVFLVPGTAAASPQGN